MYMPARLGVASRSYAFLCKSSVLSVTLIVHLDLLTTFHVIAVALFHLHHTVILFRFKNVLPASHRPLLLLCLVLYAWR